MSRRRLPGRASMTTLENTCRPKARRKTVIASEKRRKIGEMIEIDAIEKSRLPISKKRGKSKKLKDNKSLGVL